MANFQSHLIAGTISAGTLDVGAKILKKESVEPEEILLFGADLSLGALGGLLPDILEPAIHPRHRKFFHSFAFLIITGVGVWYLWERTNIFKWIKWPVTILAVGVGVHLLMDSRTSSSLPLV